MAILVLDAATVLDLHRGELLQAVFGLDHAYVLPDLTYEVELADPSLGEYLKRQGIHLADLKPPEMTRVQALRKSCELSLYECCSLVCASRSGHELVTDGPALRQHAMKDGLACRGLVDLLDELHSENLAVPSVLVRGLLVIGKTKPHRGEEDQIQARISRWAGAGTVQATIPGKVR